MLLPWLAKLPAHQRVSVRWAPGSSLQRNERPEVAQRLGCEDCDGGQVGACRLAMMCSVAACARTAQLGLGRHSIDQATRTPTHRAAYVRASRPACAVSSLLRLSAPTHLHTHPCTLQDGCPHCWKDALSALGDDAVLEAPPEKRAAALATPIEDESPKLPSGSARPPKPHKAVKQEAHAAAEQQGGAAAGPAKWGSRIQNWSIK